MVVERCEDTRILAAQVGLVVNGPLVENHSLAFPKFVLMHLPAILFDEPHGQLSSEDQSYFTSPWVGVRQVKCARGNRKHHTSDEGIEKGGAAASVEDCQWSFIQLVKEVKRVVLGCEVCSFFYLELSVRLAR